MDDENFMYAFFCGGGWLVSHWLEIGGGVGWVPFGLERGRGGGLVGSSWPRVEFDWDHVSTQGFWWVCPRGGLPPPHLVTAEVAEDPGTRQELLPSGPHQAPSPQ